MASHSTHHRRMGGGHQSQNAHRIKASSSASADTWFERQLFDYFIVVDFECTCERDRRDYPNEIIEFPAILIDVRNGGKILKEKSFRSYAKPWRNPVLTSFCTELTGITQQHVERAPDLQTAVKNFEAWYRRVIPVGAKVMMMTDGPWDFRNFVLAGAVKRDHVAFPTLMYEFIDVRTTFGNYFNKGRPAKLANMMKRFGLKFEGHEHCGFDDAYNIARLAVAMMRNGCIFSFIIALPLDEDPYHYQMDVTPLYRTDSGTSGEVGRSHVEERAKLCFGEAYYEYGRSTFTRKDGVSDDERESEEVKSIIKETERELSQLEVVSCDTDEDVSASPSKEDEETRVIRRAKRADRREARLAKKESILKRRADAIAAAADARAARQAIQRKPDQVIAKTLEKYRWIIAAAVIPLIVFALARLVL